MPDMTMCSNRSCEKRASCLRYLAVPDMAYQSYSLFLPRGGGCKDWLPVSRAAFVLSLADADSLWPAPKGEKG